MATWIGTRNLLTTATIIGGAAMATGFPNTNLLQPERPYKTTRTTTTTADNDTYFDLGTAPVSYDTAIAVNKNAPLFYMFTSTVPSFATIASSLVPSAVSIRCPWNTRYMHVAKWPSPRTERYVIHRVPGPQTTLDGAAYFSTGGLWLGTLENLTTILGRSWKWAYTFGPTYPELKIGPSHNGWSRTIRRGNPRATLAANLEPDILKASPGGADGLAQWLDLQRRIRENYFCAVIEDWHPAHALICEDLSPPPIVDYPVAHVSLHFEEAV
jgi:hypothetical protein